MQLRMFFFPQYDTIPELEVPDGYEIRQLQAGEEKKYMAMRPMSGFSEWTDEYMANYLKGPARRVMVMVDKSNGTFVQAASAEEFPEEGTGQFGWLLSNPEYRGRGFGRIISIATMQALKEEGFRKFIILTDDFRVPALRIYLKLGWHPVFFAEDMEGRWNAIREKLGIDFIPADDNGPLKV